jgi:TP901 family phage tail tape measure protein
MSFSIAFDIFARDRASQTFDKLGRSVDNAHKSFGSASGSAGKLGGAMGLIGKLGVAGAIAGMGAAAVKLGSDSVNLEATFSQTMNTMGAVANVPKDQMKGLSDLALKMGADTTFSASEAANAMLELAKGGLSAATIKSGALAGTLTLAAAGGTSLEVAATIASNALNTFGLKGKDMASVAAALAGGANASSASVESLGQALSQVGPGATNAGLSLQETVATLSAFDAAGIKGADAGTSLKTMLVALVPHTKAARNAMHDLGLKFTDAKGKFLPITNVAQQLKDKLSGLSQEQRTTALSTIFGSDATRAATVLMKQGAAGLTTFIKATQDQNAAQSVAKARMAGTAGAMESFKGSVETAKLQLGLFIAPAVQAGLGMITNAVNGIVPAAQKLSSSFGRDLTPKIREFGTWSKANLIPTLKDVAVFIGDKVLPKARQFGMFLASTLIPVVQKLVKGGLEGAKIAFDKVRKALEDNRPQLEKLSTAIGVVVTWVAQKLGPILGWLAKTQMRLLASNIVAVITVISKLVDAFVWIKNAAQKAASSAWMYISGFFSNIVSGAAKAFGWVPGLGGKLRNAAKEFGVFRDSVNNKLAGISDQQIKISPIVVAAQAGRRNAIANRLGLAGGGAVSGNGTATSDSIPAMLSNGEHVWTAREVQSAGGHGAVERMRQAVQGFAAGGRVGLSVQPRFPSLAGPMANIAALARSIAAPMAQSMAAAFASSTPSGGSGVERWRSVAMAALAAAGGSASWINSLMRRMNQESGGNPKAINLWDSNAKAGYPSQGLMQTIPGTFGAYAGPYRGRGITDPFANIYAAIRYTMARYGSGPAGWDRVGGYKLGTNYVPEDQLAYVHKGEKIIPAGMGSGSVININVTVPVGGDPVGTGRAIVQAIKAYKLTTGGRNLGIA